MTNRTMPLPRPGVGVRFRAPNTPTYSNRTTNRTPVMSEPNTLTEHRERVRTEQGFRTMRCRYCGIDTPRPALRPLWRKQGPTGIDAYLVVMTSLEPVLGRLRARIRQVGP